MVTCYASSEAPISVSSIFCQIQVFFLELSSQFNEYVFWNFLHIWIFYCSCLSADTYPSQGKPFVTSSKRSFNNLTFNETYYLSVSQADLAALTIRVYICLVVNEKLENMVR